MPILYTLLGSLSTFIPIYSISLQKVLFLFIEKYKIFLLKVKDLYYILSTMNYKPGDKVKIKTWEEMEKEYSLYPSTGLLGINAFPSESVTGPIFNQLMEEEINKRFPDRILTIKRINSQHSYSMKENYDFWTDEMIECSAEEVFIPIKTRWELLDL